MTVQDGYKKMLMEIIDKTTSDTIQSSDELIQEIINELIHNNLLAGNLNSL